MKMYLLSDNLDTYVGMRLAGVEGTVIKKNEIFKDYLDKAVKNSEIGILLISERLCIDNKEVIDKIKLNYKHPLIVEIPGRNGSSRNDDFITSYVNEAIGLKL